MVSATCFQKVTALSFPLNNNICNNSHFVLFDFYVTYVTIVMKERQHQDTQNVAQI